MTTYLVDGYNVMHELRRAERRQLRDDLAQGELEDERARLLDRIYSFMGGTSDRTIVVFDSQESSLHRGQSATANVEVYFGSFERSADDIIERAVYQLSAAESVVVVTSDYGLQKTIFRPNVIRRSARQFVADLQHHTREVANSKNCTTMVHRVEDLIDPESRKGLEALRRRLEGRPDGDEGVSGTS
ncbi:MAG: NYN domain-containing protein [Thermoleophilia bacterium]